MNRWSEALRLIGIGWYIALCLILGLAAGLWLDNKFATTPWLTLTCFGFGLIMAFVGLYRMLFPLTTKSRGNGKDDG